MGPHLGHTYREKISLRAHIGSTLVDRLCRSRHFCRSCRFCRFYRSGRFRRVCPFNCFCRFRRFRRFCRFVVVAVFVVFDVFVFFGFLGFPCNFLGRHVFGHQIQHKSQVKQNQMKCFAPAPPVVDGQKLFERAENFKNLQGERLPK